MSRSQPGRPAPDPENVSKILAVRLSEFIDASKLPPFSAGVYAFLDADGRVLYVGQSGALELRFRDHKRTKPWFKDVARTLAYPLADTDLRLCLETALILVHRPRRNRSIKIGLCKAGGIYEMQFLRSV